MINKLRLQYYKLIIKILHKFTKTKFYKKSYGYPIEYKMDHRILQLSVKCNNLYSIMYPEQITIDCLEACGIPEFEKAVQEPVLFIQDNKMQKVV
jgi:hypothetical protein